MTAVSGKAKINRETATALMNCGYAGTIEITETESSINPIKTKNDMDVTMLANRMGMAETSTEAQVLAQIDVYKRKAERTDMLERQESERREKEIETLLNEAIREKRITADVKDDWKQMLSGNFESAKRMLQAMKPVEMPRVNPPASSAAITFGGKKWEDLQDDPKALRKLMDENPDLYQKMLDDYVSRN